MDDGFSLTAWPLNGDYPVWATFYGQLLAYMFDFFVGCYVEAVDLANVFGLSDMCKWWSNI